MRTPYVTAEMALANGRADIPRKSQVLAIMLPLIEGDGDCIPAFDDSLCGDRDRERDLSFMWEQRRRKLKCRCHLSAHAGAGFLSDAELRAPPNRSAGDQAERDPAQAAAKAG